MFIIILGEKNPFLAHRHLKKKGFMPHDQFRRRLTLQPINVKPGADSDSTVAAVSSTASSKSLISDLEPFRSFLDLHLFYDFGNSDDAPKSKNGKPVEHIKCLICKEAPHTYCSCSPNHGCCADCYTAHLLQVLTDKVAH